MGVHVCWKTEDYLCPTHDNIVLKKKKDHDRVLDCGTTSRLNVLLYGRGRTFPETPFGSTWKDIGSFVYQVDRVSRYIFRLEERMGLGPWRSREIKRSLISKSKEKKKKNKISSEKNFYFWFWGSWITVGYN